VFLIKKHLYLIHTVKTYAVFKFTFDSISVVFLSKGSIKLKHIFVLLFVIYFRCSIHVVIYIFKLRICS